MTKALAKKIATGITKQGETYHVQAIRRKSKSKIDKRERTYVAKKLANGNVEIASARNNDIREIAKAEVVEELIRIRRAMLVELATGLKSAAKDVRTFGDVLNLYIESPKQSGDRRSITREDSRFCWLMEKAGDLEPSWTYRWLMAQRNLVEQGKHECGWSKSTFNRAASLAKASMNFASKEINPATGESYLPRNYMASFPMFPEPKGRYFILQSGQREKFWRHLHPFYRPLYYCACRTPARVGELLNIKKSWVNPETMTISLVSGEVKNRKSGGRTIALWPEFRPYIDGFMQSSAEYLFNTGHPNYEPLGIAGKDNRRKWGGRHARKAWAVACIAAGISPKGSEEDGYNFHKTRQEAVMHLYQQTKSIDSVMLFGGWESRAAIKHYWDKAFANMIDSGMVELDVSWQQTFANDIADYYLASTIENLIASI